MRGCRFLYILFALLLLGGSGRAQPPTPRLLVHRGEPAELVDLLSDYIAIESVSGNGRAAGHFLRQLCAEQGLYITPMGDRNGNYNFAASIRPLSDSLPNLIFLNHIDGVPAERSRSWVHPPFSGHVTDTEVWGRGAFDNKGVAMIQLASVVEALSAFRGQSIPYNVTFLAVSCEEIQCTGGARYVIEHHPKELNPAVVIGEGPPALTGVLRNFPERQLFGISVAHKNALWIKLEITVETTGHGSITPLRYANRELVTALNRLLEKRPGVTFTDLNISLLKQLGELEGGVTGFLLKHPRLFKPLLVPQLRKQPERFALFSNTLTLTDLDSRNGVVNILPPTATALLDCRLLPLSSPERFVKRLRRKLDNPNIKLSVLKQMPETEPSSPQSVFFQHLAASIRMHYPESSVASIFLPSSSDLGLFRSAGIPAFASVPVHLDRVYLNHIHHVNERIPRSILQEGPEVYNAFIRRCMEDRNVGLTN